MNTDKIITSIKEFKESLNTYSMILNIFKPINIELLRSIDDICKDYDGVGIDSEYI